MISQKMRDETSFLLHLFTLQGTGTATFPNTINLNQTAGGQLITCSAPSGLSIKTTTNTAAISFGAQSSQEIITRNNPRFYNEIFSKK